jgi:putative endonuclease
MDSRFRGNDKCEFDVGMSKNGYVYILASKKIGTLYVGVTSDLVRRVFEHREGFVAGFTKTHGIKMLVHFEIYENIEEAIRREKAVKKWNRAWKIELIEQTNPDWTDLYPEIAK